jgi:hypothetical protein
MALANLKTPAQDEVTLGDVLRLKIGSTMAKAEIVMATLTGQLHVTGRIDESFSGLLLDKTEAENLVSEKRLETSGNSYSQQEAAKITGIDLAAIPSAIDSGLLEGVRQGIRLRVTANSVKKFTAEFVPLSKIAAKLATLSRSLLEEIRRRDIPIVYLSRGKNLSKQPVLSQQAANLLRGRFS